MLIHRLWLTDFRNYRAVDLRFGPGVTAVLGSNGQGKTNLLEGIAYLATLNSFRAAPTEAMVRAGATRAVIRGEGDREGRTLLLEAELVTNGRNRAQVNRQPLRRTSALLGALRVTVFSPDDLALVKGSAGQRRQYLDDGLVALHPRHQDTRSEVERVLRQRNALLKQAGGRLTRDVESTLDVWDTKLAAAGETLASAREELVDRLGPMLGVAYDQLASTQAHALLRYRPSWGAGGLGTALAAGRGDDLRRGITLVGPHRDDLEVTIGELPARTHASQGEQRSLALALRLSLHRLVTESTQSTPVLLLDDVFSELDQERGHALIAHLPVGQTVITAAHGLPQMARPDGVIDVADGHARART